MVNKSTSSAHDESGGSVCKHLKVFLPSCVQSLSFTCPSLSTAIFPCPSPQISEKSITSHKHSTFSYTLFPFFYLPFLLLPKKTGKACHVLYRTYTRKGRCGTPGGVVFVISENTPPGTKCVSGWILFFNGISRGVMSPGEKILFYNGISRGVMSPGEKESPMYSFSNLTL